MGGILSTSTSTSRDDSTIYHPDEFTDDDVSETDPIWTSTEEQELINLVLSDIDWDALADVLQENDIDKTGQECRNWISRRFAELSRSPSKVHFTGSQD